MEIPSHFGIVIIVAVLILLSTQWTSIQVGMARKKYGLRYPEMYAIKGATYRGVGVQCGTTETDLSELMLTNDEVTTFNCFQRAHQNTLEALPLVLTLLVLAGLWAPMLSSVSGLVWIVGRAAYVSGYQSGDPRLRHSNMAKLQHAGVIILLVTTMCHAFKTL
ncbi:MAG: uncharacterized protein KVP18_003571 [Porospora cf. gigantea A]|uniref:uncharacterized protein n=1 Tax=Porospora cf. gigantea A TaxID=2853593 RepID=UPI00355A1A31|nr:MAG: hypothetical protein KVP18_003571 [Porospora cf. gigantea A]